MILRLAAFLLLLPVSVSAQSFPALFDVVGVAVEDTLNIRAEPSAMAEKIGALAHDATGIEVVSQNESGSWGRINQGETSGWVSLRYLERRADTPEAPLAPRLRCFGTEPFWSLHIVQGALAEFEVPGTEIRLTGTPHLIASRNQPGRWGVTMTNGAATLRSEQCSDGMSDRTFGLSVDFLLTRGGSSDLYSGCCSLHDH